jgi:hypothetical protein
MARYSAGAKTSAGSTVLPIISLYSGASVGAKIREIGVFNTTSTAVDIKLVRLTSAGTQGAGLTEAKYDPDSAAASCSAYNTHSGNPSLGDDLGYRASLGAAVGAGIIWTFGDQGLRTPTGSANGVGVIVENGTGQPCQAYLVWDE